MSISEYHGQTFVAFMDISGFKEKMKRHNEAGIALSRFFSAGYTVLKDQNNTDESCKVDGIFISDSGILFSRYNGGSPINGCSKEEALIAMLKIIKEISQIVLQHDLMLTTSISFGDFNYNETIKFDGIEKNMILGNAYLNTYLDNEVGKPKLTPGKCRYLKSDNDENFFDMLTSSNHSLFQFLRKVPKDKSHLYFYWMVNREEDIERFNDEYANAYNLKYRGMIEALNNFKW